MYGLGDSAKNAEASIIHVEGDPDHPVNRGTLCPKGGRPAGFHPQRESPALSRIPGAGVGSLGERITWDDALNRIAKLKADRDKNFIAKNADGLTVNRWTSTAMLAASAASNEVGYLTHKVMRTFGMLAFDNQARV